MYQNHTMECFDISFDTSLKERTKQYYDMTLLCHPDNVESTDDIQVVQHCYQESKQITQQKKESEERFRNELDVLEKGDSNALHMTNTLPCIRDIVDEAHDSFPISFNACQNNDTTPLHLHVYNIKDSYAEQANGEYMIERWQTSIQPSVHHANIQEKEHRRRPLPSLDTPPRTPSNHIGTTSTSLTNQTNFMQERCSTENNTIIRYPVDVHSEQHVHDFTVSTPLFKHACTKHILKRVDCKSDFEHTL